uniref:Uncharacterized protein n=1 Tax=Electrophorus electricus TaxID=8005 RepID=A0A4W4EWC2_ELEEL
TRTPPARSRPRRGPRRAPAGPASRAVCSPPSPPHTPSVAATTGSRPGRPGRAHSDQCHCGRSRGLWRWGEDRREHRRGERGRVVVDVCHHYTPLEQIHPALQRANHRHLEVQEALVLVKDHLALGQLLAVYPATVSGQLPGNVVYLEVLRAGFQRERHVPRADAGGGETEVCSHVPDAHVGRSLFCYAVAQR